MDVRSGQQLRQIELARALRGQGESWRAIAGALRARFRVNARVAMRLAHGWGQAEVAAEWNRRWPDEPKTFKNISYWENWPSRTGYAPSLAVLDRLAQIYQCDVADLLDDWGNYHVEADSDQSPEATALAWQVEHLSPDELARALAEWSRRLSPRTRRSLLLKLSAAAASAADRGMPDGRAILGAAPSPRELAGVWDSEYTFHSTGRDAEFTYTHRVDLRLEHGRLVGRSLPTDTGTIELDLAVDGPLVTGSWTEYTAPSGYYRGAVYHGVLQLVLDPTGRSMVGQWLGPDKHFVINSGPWRLIRGS